VPPPGPALAWLDAHRAHVAVGALATGLALAPALPRSNLIAAAPLGTLLASVGAAAVLRALGSPRAFLVAVVALGIGVAVGSARVTAIDRTAERALVVDRVDGSAVVLQRPRRTRFGSWAIVELRTGPAAGSRVAARADGGMRWPGGGDPGVAVLVSGSLERPRHTPGSRLDWPAHLRRRGVAAELELDSLRPAGSRRGGFAGRVDAVRHLAEAGVGAGDDSPAAAVVRGMVLGQDEAIDPLVVEDFRRSGLGHLLAVSGQNVVLLCALAVPVLMAAGLGVRGRVAWLAGIVALYVLVAGAGPSLQRAAAMAIAGLAALAVGRVRSRWYALLVAAAVTLAVDPRVAAEPGWQLSFAAVTGILLLAPPLRRRLGGLPRPLADGVSMTLAATVATAPIAGHHFGVVSVAGLGANLVALPLVAPIVWLGLVQATLGIAAGAVPGLHEPAMGAAALLGRVTRALAGALVRVAEEFASLPGAELRLPLGSTLAVVAAYALPLGAWLALRGAAPGLPGAAGSYASGLPDASGGGAWRGTLARPRGTLARAAWTLRARAQALAAAWRRAALHRRFAVLVAGAALLAIAWQRAAGPSAPPERLTVSFLDVGQGDATLVQDGSGAAVLFDGGPPEARTYRLLRRAGVRRLELVVATHASRDHHGGLPEVLRRIPTGAFLDGGDGSRDPGFAAVLDEARRRGIRLIAPRAGQTLAAGRLRIRILGPPPRPPGPPPSDPNPRALTTVVSAGAFDLFLSGDAESPALLGYDLPRVEAMKVPHHGSADPGLPRLLDRLGPRVAAIEVGEGNPYGHPTPSTLAALRAKVPHVRRTDEDGTVRLTVGADGRMELP
jgi:competence protein ComEC